MTSQNAVTSIAILGTGYMASMHVRSLKAMPDVHIGAICARSKMKGDEFVNDQSLSGAAVYNEYGRMCDEVSPDAVIVTLPPHAHAGEVECAAERGIAVFLEKPLARDPDRAQSMADAIRKHNVVSQVGYHYRFKRSVKRMKELITSGRAGRPALFEGRFWSNMEGKPWWRSRSMSGGQTFEQATHIFDTARFLMGDVLTVQGHIATLCHPIKDDRIEDVSAAILKMENGSLALISASNCAFPGKCIGDFRAVFQRCVLDYRSTGDWCDKDTATITFTDGSGPTEAFIEDSDAHAEEMRDFLDAVSNGGPTVTPAADGIITQRTVEAMLASAEHDGVPIAVGTEQNMNKGALQCQNVLP
ncbi:MAG: Gfo/Idh/MocA family oxidoreductase [Spirochaetota bacterium]